MGQKKGDRLTARGIESETRPGRYIDGPNSLGLAVRIKVRSNGSLAKSVVQRLRIKSKDPYDREYTFGPYAVVGLSKARTKAKVYAGMAAEGIDPEPHEAKVIPTFAEATEATIEIQGYSTTSKKPEEWRSLTGNYVLPVIGAKGVKEVTRADILDIMIPLWNVNNPSARTLLRKMKKVFDWCISQGHREYNPADNVAVMALPRRRHTVEHYAAVEHRDTERYLKRVRGLTEYDLSLIIGYEFVALTGVRHQEGFGARWDEIHLDYVVFIPKNPSISPLTYPCLVIPPERMKNGEEPHVVPLSRQVLKLLLQALTLRNRHPKYIFPTVNGHAIRPGNVHKLRKKTGMSGTTHGFRATLSTWGQTFDVPTEVVEMSLAHKIHGVRGAYARSVLLANRTYMMQDYADYNYGTISPNYVWSNRFIPENPTTYPDRPNLSCEEWLALKEATQSNPDFTLFEDVQNAFKAVRLSNEDPSVVLAFLFMALTASQPTVVLKAVSSNVDMETSTWFIPREHNSKSHQEYSIPLSRAAQAVAAKAQTIGRQNSAILFQSRKGEAISGSALNNLCRKLRLTITPTAFRNALTLWCEESGVPKELVREVCGYKKSQSLVSSNQPDTTLKARAKLMQAWARFLEGRLPANWRWRN